MFRRKPCPACEARDQTIIILQEQLRLAHMRAADAEGQARRRAPMRYEEVPSLDQMPMNQVASGLGRVLWNDEGTESVIIPFDDEEVPA